MKKLVFFANLISIIIIVIALSIVIINTLAESFFFDKLIYRKSPSFGYIHTYWNALANTDNPPTIKQRLADLLFLKETYSHWLRVKEPSDIYTIVVIGDSIAYGTGVKVNERFGSVLEEKLNKFRDTKVYILAQPGDSIVDNYAKYLLAKNTLKPDLFIFGVVENDLIIDKDNKYPHSRYVYDQLRRTCPQPEFEYNWNNPTETWSFLLENIYLNSFDPQFANVCYLDKIINNVTHHDNTIFVSLTYSNQWLDQQNTAKNKNALESYNKIKNSYFNSIKKYTHRLIIPEENPSYTYTPVSKKEEHPSAAMHQFYADILSKEITANDFLISPKTQ